MQTTEQGLDVLSPAAATEEPDNHLTPVEADEIFRQAEAEIKPLLRKMRREALVQNMLEALCWVGIVASVVGMVYQAITYPHTAVLLVTNARPASITTTLDVASRTLAPITITRSATRATTGRGQQKAARATGFLTFYNGLSIVQSVTAGTVLAGSDGVRIVTDQTANIPPNAPPEDGSITVTAHALTPGASGNITAYDVALALSSSLTVKNLAAFTGGRDARTLKAVAPHDLAALAATVSATLAQAFTSAFSLQPSEEDFLTNCHTATSSSHQIGEEATSVTVTGVKTCSAVAYKQSELTRAATAAFTKTRPGANYHIVGGVQTTLQSVSPLTVRLSGKWAYTFTSDYEQLLAQQIQGESPAKAKAYLLKTDVISYASIPNTLPAAMYINFAVLVE